MLCRNAGVIVADGGWLLRDSQAEIFDEDWGQIDKHPIARGAEKDGVEINRVVP